MQAIVTRYIGPSNKRGTRIKATAATGSIIVSYDYSANIDKNHEAAAHLFATKLGWLTPTSGTLVSGTMANGDYCHVFTY